MLHYLGSNVSEGDSKSRRVEGLGRLSRVAVVARVAAAHVDFASATATVLFGLADETLVRIIDIADVAELDALSTPPEVRDRDHANVGQRLSH